MLLFPSRRAMMRNTYSALVIDAIASAMTYNNCLDYEFLIIAEDN